MIQRIKVTNIIKNIFKVLLLNKGSDPFDFRPTARRMMLEVIIMRATKKGYKPGPGRLKDPNP